MTIQRFILSAAPLLALVLFATAHAQMDPTAPDAVVEYGGPDPVIVETREGPVEFIAEIAATDASRARGMMYRESMGPNEAMLFDFVVVQPVAIWMANTLIPLDVIFIREDGTIAKIVANAQPLSRRSLPSDFPVLAVLEIAGGRAAETGIAPGDLVRHSLFGTQASSEPAADTAEGEPEIVEANEGEEVEDAAEPSQEEAAE
ncbi:MAG: DUF192 domain-containing protein [Caulobacterales bacterium]|uniref:DUF192 domain-containing protein n=1 Tax=Glycocaulis sp. TaxID=1969725 RepID=UPI003FA024FA